MSTEPPKRKYQGTTYFTPPNCPRDPALYVTMVTMLILDDENESHRVGPDGKPGPFSGGVIDRTTGEVWGVSEKRQTKTLIDLNVIDKLLKLEWIVADGVEHLALTKLGKHWMARFVELNRSRQ